MTVLQFTEITIYSFYCKAQQKLKEICVVKQKPREQPHKSHEQCILQKRHLMVDRSIFASYAEAYELFCFPGGFLWVRDAGHRGIKIPAWGLRD